MMNGKKRIPNLRDEESQVQGSRGNVFYMSDEPDSNDNLIANSDDNNPVNPDGANNYLDQPGEARNYREENIHPFRKYYWNNLTVLRWISCLFIVLLCTNVATLIERHTLQTKPIPTSPSPPATTPKPSTTIASSTSITPANPSTTTTAVASSTGVPEHYPNATMTNQETVNRVMDLMVKGCGVPESKCANLSLYIDRSQSIFTQYDIDNVNLICIPVMQCPENLFICQGYQKFEGKPCVPTSVYYTEHEINLIPYHSSMPNKKKTYKVTVENHGSCGCGKLGILETLVQLQKPKKGRYYVGNSD